jgi:outer membrane protein OmpA-like peptidoglycan-associated protein
MNNIFVSRNTLTFGITALAFATATGCASLNKKETGAIIGAGSGAVIGGVIGNNTGSTARGAIIGAAVGGTIGAVIGHQMDQQAKELKQNIPGAVVERVGEGIQVTFESGLLFDFDSDRVRPEAAANLRNLASSLDKYPNSDLLIVGHTDSVGTDAYNLSLSDRRSRATASYLVAQGVSSSRLRTAGRGEAVPVVANDTEANRSKNRRVEVAIYASQAYRNSLRQQYAPTNR